MKTASITIASLLLAAPGLAQEFVAIETEEFQGNVARKIDVDGNVIALGSFSAVEIRFRNIFGEWITEVTLPASGVVGSFLASGLSGNWLAAGDSSADLGNGSMGKVQLWERLSPGLWNQADTLTPSDGALFDRFGLSLDIEGDLLVTGAPNKSTGSVVTGAAYIFERGAQGWQEAARLSPPAGVIPTGMGTDVAIDGERVLVVANDQVFVYERQAGNWRHTATLEPTPQLGLPVDSLDLEGDLAIFGVTEFASGEGAVMVFENAAGGWQRTATLRAPEGQNGDNLGREVSLSEGVIAAGSPFDGYNSSAKGGSAHLFARAGNGEFVHVETIAPSGNMAFVEFGGDVHLEGSELIVTTLSGAAPTVYEVLPAHPNTYCQSTPNNSGESATLWTEGSLSVAANDLVLFAGPTPSLFTTGGFIYGDGQAQTPFGAGILCVSGSPLHRLPVLPLPEGLAHRFELDLTAPPASPGSQILPGSTWNFQSWYRQFTGIWTVNFSSATSLTFTP